MNVYEVTTWVNINEYLETHLIECSNLEMISNDTLLINNVAKIKFNDDIQKILDTTNKVIIFEDDD